MTPFIRLRCIVILFGCGFLLQGCDSPCDVVQNEIKSIDEQISAKASAATQAMLDAWHPGFGSSGLQSVNASSAVLAAAAPSAEKRLALKAILDQHESFLTFPNQSFGKFTAQVTVAANSQIGLVDGESRAFLEFRQPTLQPVARRLYIAAVYDQAILGFRAVVSGIDGTSFGIPLPFPDLSEIDLRIQQTETQLIFSARATPADQAAGGWTPIYTLETPPDPSYFHVYVGIRYVKKHGVFFFTNFALDGDAIGGELEYPVITDFRASVDAIRAAQVKLNVALPDFTAALVDLDRAITANGDAQAKIDDRLHQMQSVFYAKNALKTAQGAAKELATIRNAVAAQNSAKLKPQLAKLETVATAQLSAMGNMLGWSVRNLKSAPKLFSVRIP